MRAGLDQSRRGIAPARAFRSQRAARAERAHADRLGGNAALSPAVEAFYRYHADHQPWDGQRLAFFGRSVRRRGARPQCPAAVPLQRHRRGPRALVPEVGAIELDDYRLSKGAWGQQMLALDLERHQILHDHELKRELLNDRGRGVSRGLALTPALSQRERE
jgi:hypothetical protein